MSSPFVFRILTQGKWKLFFYRKICIQKFIAALFAMAKNWKQLKCLSIGEWTNCAIFFIAKCHQSVIRKWTSNEYSNMGKPHKLYAEKEYVLPSLWNPGKDTFNQSWQGTISGFLRLEERIYIMWHKGPFYDSGNVLEFDPGWTYKNLLIN